MITVLSYFNLLFRYFDKQLSVHGELSVPLRLASIKAGYKYVLLNKKDDAVYEELVGYQSMIGGHVNRCLVLEEENVTENSKLTK